MVKLLSIMLLVVVSSMTGELVRRAMSSLTHPTPCVGPRALPAP